MFLGLLDPDPDPIVRGYHDFLSLKNDVKEISRKTFLN
jgi:hypothetical protein